MWNFGTIDLQKRDYWVGKTGLLTCHFARLMVPNQGPSQVSMVPFSGLYQAPVIVPFLGLSRWGSRGVLVTVCKRQPGHWNPFYCRYP